MPKKAEASHHLVEVALFHGAKSVQGTTPLKFGKVGTTLEKFNIRQRTRSKAFAHENVLLVFFVKLTH